jgi:5-(carboxyamino)imidazole ribonucleotide mutase
MPKAALIMGSKSDWPSLEGCVKVLRSFGIEVEVHVASAHRTPEKVAVFADHARENGFEVIIAAAGKAAHLAGVIAGHTTLPVIGIPIKSSLMDGLDSLLSTVQMPTGIPVATVAINGAANEALLCAQIIAVEDQELAKKLDAKRVSEAQKVLQKDADIAANL